MELLVRVYEDVPHVSNTLAGTPEDLPGDALYS